MDDSGRIQLPSKSHKWISIFGKEVFITTLDGKSVVIYPRLVWSDYRRELERTGKRKYVKAFLRRANFYGLITEMDSRGRIDIGQRLREKTGLEGRLIIEEEQDHVRVIKADN